MLLLVLLVVLFPSLARAAEYHGVLINELNWAGSSASTADEWIELKNQTDAPIDISSWQIEGAATSGGALTTPAGSTIPSKGFFLIANFAATSSQSTLNITPDWVTTAVSLRNSNALYRLIDSAGKHIDEADDGAGAPLAGDNTTKASMERNRQVGSGSSVGSWHSSYQTVNVDLGVSQFGTPKSENNALPTVTLGRVSPSSTGSGERNQFSVDYEINDLDGLSDILQAQIDLRDLGSNLFDLDIHDAHAKYVIEPPSLGNRSWSIMVTDRQGGVKTASNTLAVFQSALGVSLSEVLPRPQEGSDFEWIELYNAAAHPINLSDFQLDDSADGGSSPYTFTSGTTINSNSFLVLEKSEHGLNLNDDGDVVRLLDPNGNLVVNTPNWGKAERGQSFSIVSALWQWTTELTKGAINLSTPSATPPPPASTSTPTPEPVLKPEPAAPIASADQSQTAQPFDSSRAPVEGLAQGKPTEPSTPSTIEGSKKLVKGITITRQETPVTPEPSKLRNAPWIVAAMIALQESTLLWSRKRKLQSKPLTVADPML